MHVSKDSMWREIWKILQNFLGTKQGLGLVWFQKSLQDFSDSPSYQILRHIHETLNIDKRNN